MKTLKVVLAIVLMFCLGSAVGCGGDDDDGGGVCAKCCQCTCEGPGCMVTFSAQPTEVAEDECLDCDEQCDICSMPFIACGQVTSALVCVD